MSKEKATKKVTTVKAKDFNETGVTIGETGRKFKNVSENKNYWKPKTGDAIEGSFVEMSERILEAKSQFGEPELREGNKVKVQYSGVIASEKTGELTYMPSTKVMNDFFKGDEDKKTKPVKEGEFVRITYEGKKLKKGKTMDDKNPDYHAYKLEREVQ